MFIPALILDLGNTLESYDPGPTFPGVDPKVFTRSLGALSYMVVFYFLNCN